MLAVWCGVDFRGNCGLKTSQMFVIMQRAQRVFLSLRMKIEKNVFLPETARNTKIIRKASRNHLLPISIMSASTGKRKEIYKYLAPWPLYSMNWSVRPDKRFRLALGSFIEEYNNKVQIISLDEETSEFSAKSTFDHPYPTTKIMWIPDAKGIFPDLLATSGDYLRVWRAGEPDTRLECVLNNNKNSDFCAPLTSFDWNEVDPNLVGTSSIDTTCTIWGLETGQALGRVNMVSGHVKTQLIAHDKEVYDIAFSRAGGGRDMFASVGADGSVRMFDLRHLEHSTIIYEDPGHVPLLRLAWNKQDPNYLATVAMDSCEVIILDVRVPCTPVARLSNHRACVNGIAWAPHRCVRLLLLWTWWFFCGVICLLLILKSHKALVSARVTFARPATITRR